VKRNDSPLLFLISSALVVGSTILGSAVLIKIAVRVAVWLPDWLCLTVLWIVICTIAYIGWKK